MPDDPPPDWPRQLAPGSPHREDAVRRLRQLLIKGLAGGLSGPRRTDAAFIEDIAQIALVRILDRLDTFNARSAFTTWALAIALRIAFTELRRRDWNNVSLDALATTDHAPVELPDDRPGPDAHAETQHLKALVNTLIQTELTPRQRLVLVAELNNMPQDEIATQLGSNRNAIYKLGYDARKALKRALETRGLHAADLFDTQPRTT